MSETIFELLTECPKCEEQIFHEFDLNNITRSSQGFYFHSQKEKLKCMECGYTWEAHASGEIEVFT